MSDYSFEDRNFSKFIKLEKNSIISIFVFVFSYLATIYIFRDILNINKYIESTAIAVIPMVITFVSISINNELEYVTKFIKFYLLPIFILEKLAVPLSKFLGGITATTKDPSFPNLTPFEIYLGFTPDKYMRYLFEGKVNGIMWFNWYYILLSTIIFIILYISRGWIIKLISKSTATD